MFEDDDDEEGWDTYMDDEYENDMFDEFIPGRYWNEAMRGDGDEYDSENGDGPPWMVDDEDEDSFGLGEYYDDDYEEDEEEYIANMLGLGFMSGRRPNLQPPCRGNHVPNISQLHSEMFRIQFGGVEYEDKYLMQRAYEQSQLDANENNPDGENVADTQLNHAEDSDDEGYVFPQGFRRPHHS